MPVSLFLAAVLAQPVTTPTGVTAATVVAPAPVNAPAAVTAEAARSAPTIASIADEDDPGQLEVTVLATRSGSAATALPPMITVVGRDELERRPADQTPNLLAGTPGVLIQKSNHGGGAPFIHGMTGKQVLLMIDGVRMNNSLYRFGPHQYLNTIDPYTIDRIEVVRGPASVLHGTDALGGVINVITRDPAPQLPRPGAAAGVSSADSSLRGRFQVDGQFSQLGLRAGASARRFQNLRAGGGIGVQRATGYDEAAADLKITHDLSGDTRLTGATQLVRQYEVPKSNEVLLGGKLKYDYEPQLRWLTYAKVASRLDTPVADGVELGVSMQSHEEGEVIVAKPGGPERRERNDARTFGTFLHLVKDAPLGNRIGLGGDWYADRIDSSALEAGTTGTRTARPTFPDGARYETFGAYLQDEWRPVQSVGVILGGRYTRFKASGSLPSASGSTALHLDSDDLTASAGVNWEFVPGLFAAAQAAQGFRAPNLEDFFGKVDFKTEVPNTALRPEKSNDYEAGLKLRRWGFDGQAFYYRSYYRDLIERIDVSVDPEGDGTFMEAAQRRNVGRARIHGVESGLAYSIELLEVFGSYSWTFGDVLAKKNGEWEPVEPLRRMPPRQGTGGVRVLLPAESFAQADVAWSLRQDRLAKGDVSDPRIGPAGTPGYVVLNLRAGVGLGERGRLRVGVENVLDKQYKTHGSGIWLAGRNAYLDYAIGL